MGLLLTEPLSNIEEVELDMFSPKISASAPERLLGSDGSPALVEYNNSMVVAHLCSLERRVSEVHQYFPKHFIAVKHIIWLLLLPRPLKHSPPTFPSTVAYHQAILEQQLRSGASAI